MWRWPPPSGRPWRRGPPLTRRHTTTTSRGKNYYDRTGGRDGRDLRSSEDLYRKALELDPKFAQAWAALALTHDALYWFFFDRSEARLAQERQAAERALSLGPSLPEAHVAMGYYHYHGHLDYDAALTEFELARAARPNDSEVLAAIAFVQRRQGKWQEAYANLKQAAALDPRSLQSLSEAGNTGVQLKHSTRRKPTWPARRRCRPTRPTCTRTWRCCGSSRTATP